MIKGETVILVVKEQVDTDPMGAPIYGDPKYEPVETSASGILPQILSSKQMT